MKSIFDRSIKERVFPSDWKKAIIVPIPKTHPPVLQKLRTISLLPTPSKIFEKLILKTLNAKFEPLFGNCQHAFRKSASTTTALIQLLDTATLIYDDPKFQGFAVMSLDLSRAFDRVSHQILLKKAIVGLPKGFISWLHNYLTGRNFQVRIQGQLSDSYRLFSGVPQGSVLGPALFSILVGDLPKYDNDNTFIQYADDLNIVCSLTNDDPVHIKGMILNQFHEISAWCNLNSQELNAEKSKFLLCTRQPVHVDDALPIKRVPSLTVLGVRVSEQLSWGDHVSMICRKASQRLHILRKAKPYVDQQELHNIYSAIVRSIFDYCCPAFIHLPKNLCEDIRRIERRAHKVIYGKDNFKCSCVIEGLIGRRRMLGVKLFHNIKNNKSHTLHFRTPSTLPHNTRFANFTCRTDKRKHSFFPYTTLLVNNNL